MFSTARMLIGAFLLASCTPRETWVDEGSRALALGQHRIAREAFEAALARDLGEPLSLRARKGWIAATIPRDPEAARERLWEFQAWPAGRLTAEDFRDLVGRFASEGAWPEAVELLETGRSLYPGEEPVFEPLERAFRRHRARFPPRPWHELCRDGT